MILLRLEEDAINNFKQSEKAYREFIHTPIHVGNGIWDQIDSTHPLEWEDMEADEYGGTLKNK